VESAAVVDVEDGFFADEVGGQAVAADNTCAEVGEERGGGREVVFTVALVDLGGGLGTVYILSILDLARMCISLGPESSTHPH